MFYISLIGKTIEKIFLFETIRPRDLIFGMLHHLVDLYQVCSNYALGGEIWFRPKVTYFTQAYIGKHGKIFSSETIRPRALIFGM